MEVPQPLPVGFDRADGITSLPAQPLGASNFPAGVVGTHAPPEALIVDGPNGSTQQPVNEAVDSPEIERAEQATFSHRLTMTWQQCLYCIQFLGRGTFVKDVAGNIWRILSSKIQHSVGADSGTLTYVAESISFDSPPDDYQLLPVELGIDIIKHPRYSWALLPYVSDQTTFITVGDTNIYYIQIKEALIRMIQSYRDSPIYPDASTINGATQSSIMSQISNGKISVNWPNPNFKSSNPVAAVNWDGYNADTPSVNCPYFIIQVPVDIGNPNDPIAIALAAAQEIISKLWRQEDTPYVVGYQITWSQYYFAPVYENPGGYLENPVGIVPDYFLSPSQNGSDTIFDNMVVINPQSYANDGTTTGTLDISWLRKADEVTYERTWFKITRTWIGSPIGHWDNDIYLDIKENGPQNADDFNRLPSSRG
ncbi:MAG: hypothetical protein KGL39_10215 [Patescibacteria group bacterium]|nr:hypothetical protein [Patescibacteria group bacterium]